MSERRMKTLAWVATLGFLSLGTLTAYWAVYRPTLIIRHCQKLAVDIKYGALDNPEVSGVRTLDSAERMRRVAYRSCLRQNGIDLGWGYPDE
jgi:hypothetical protein